MVPALLSNIQCECRVSGCIDAKPTLNVVDDYERGRAVVISFLAGWDCALALDSKRTKSSLLLRTSNRSAVLA